VILKGSIPTGHTIPKSPRATPPAVKAEWDSSTRVPVPLHGVLPFKHLVDVVLLPHKSRPGSKKITQAIWSLPNVAPRETGLKVIRDNSAPHLLGGGIENTPVALGVSLCPTIGQPWREAITHPARLPIRRIPLIN
jgi:hypothetical protein